MIGRTTVARAALCGTAIVLCAREPVRAQLDCLIEPCPPAAGAVPVEQMWEAAAEAHQFKLQFVAALRDFTRAQSGLVGDEAEALGASVEAMRRALGRWERRIGELETALATVRRTADVHVALATVYLDRHRPRDALRELAAAARLNGSRLDVHTLQAHAQTLAGNAEGAANALRRAAAIAPADPVILYGLAQQLTRVGRTDEAADALARFSTVVVDVAVRSGRPAAAPFERVDLLRQAAGVAPLFPVELYSDGYAALARGDYRDALSRFARAAAADPLATGAARLRGLRRDAGAALRRGDTAAAIDVLRRAAAGPDVSADTHRMLALAFSIDGHNDLAVEHLATAVRLDPRNERAHVSLADALIAAGRNDAAEQQLQLTLTQFPRSGQVRFRLGELYQSQARYPEAVAAFEASLAFGPVVGKDHLYQAIGAIYVSQADLERAVSAYASRIEVNPNSAEAHRRLAEIYFLQGRDVEALAEFLTTTLVDPSDPRAFAGAGQVHLRAKRYSQAAGVLARAVALGGGDAETRYALGIALIRSGRDQDGQAQLAASQQLQADKMAAGQRDFELQARRRRALDGLAAGQYAEAIAELEELIAVQAVERSPDLHNRLAAGYASLGSADEAARHRAEAARLVAERRQQRVRDLAGTP